MMKILITGSSGFVGRNLNKSLKEDYTIVTKSFRYKKGQKIEINQDVIVHLSGKAHDFKKSSNSNPYLEANFELTKQLYSAFLKSNASKFLFFSSVKAVADSIKGKLDSSKVPSPKTHYGISKRNYNRPTTGCCGFQRIC